MAISLGVAGSAAAQGATDAPGRREFDDAARQFEVGNHQLALEGFLRTHELMVEAGNENASLLWFNIARAQEELGRPADALASFERFLSESGPDAPYREQTVDRLRELRARLAAQATATTTEPPSSPAPPTVRAPTPAASSPLPAIGWITVGVGALTALAAIPTGVLALDNEAQLEAACTNGVCGAAESSRISETNTLSVATDVLWATGVSVAVVGAILVLVGELTGTSESGGIARVMPTMTCELTGCVAGAGGTF